MNQQKKIVTVHKYLDWWLVECFFLFSIAGSTFYLMSLIMSGSDYTNIVLPKWNYIPWYIASILAAIAAIRVTEKNEKIGLALLATSWVLMSLTGLLRLERFVQYSYLIWFVISISSYFFIRKAGQERRLNFIKTLYGATRSKALFFNVAFFESVAIVLGFDMFGLANNHDATGLSLMIHSLFSLLVGVLLYSALGATGRRKMLRWMALIIALVILSILIVVLYKKFD